MPHEGATLHTEARIFARYIIGEEPRDEFIARYAAAHEFILTNPSDRFDRQLLNLVKSNSWSLPFLDAATGLFLPGSLLRKKLLVMSAILEASPVYAQKFLPKTASRGALFFHLALAALTTGLKTAVGVPILLFARMIPR